MVEWKVASMPDWSVDWDGEITWWTVSDGSHVPVALVPLGNSYGDRPEKLATILTAPETATQRDELLALVIQYRDDLLHPDLLDGSRARRMEAINAAITKATEGLNDE